MTTRGISEARGGGAKERGFFWLNLLGALDTKLLPLDGATHWQAESVSRWDQTNLWVTGASEESPEGRGLGSPGCRLGFLIWREAL